MIHRPLVRGKAFACWLAVFMLMFASTGLLCSQDLTGIKCVVDGDKNAHPDFTAKSHDGTIYFCCPKCAERFKADHESFATRANHQLVLTGQYEQSACPISQNETHPDFATAVGGTQIKFCCAKCLGKVEAAASLAEKAQMVFGEQVFEKAFVPVTETPE